MTSLIARLQLATGPSRELGDEVLIACGWTKFRWNSAPRWRRHDGVSIHAVTRPNPTASIDAALTLIPEGFAWSVQFSNSMLADAWLYPPDYDGDIEFKGHAATTAIALCIAILKSRGVE
jgi:hypothetical protein